MKKGKKTLIFTIGLSCFALATVMSMQFKIVNETDITLIETMREEELKEELASWKEKYKEAEQQYAEVQEKIEDYKTKKESNIETSALVQSEFEQAKQLLGLTNIEGEGIEITIKENACEDYTRISGNSLVSMVNSLKNAGAEAISINDERIINMSDIVDINDTFIKINGERILAPYIIKAIGNKAYLESALLGAGGYAEQLKNMGHEVKIIQSDKVLVKKYKNEVNYKYIKD